MDALVADIQTALKARIQRLDWMGTDTQARALEKLSKFTVKIGYPAKWRDYGRPTLSHSDLYGNVIPAAADEGDKEVARPHEALGQNERGLNPPALHSHDTALDKQIAVP